MSQPAVQPGTYALVTAAYWGFTITDGALRMLVLLHFHELGFSPVTLAFLFLFYEFFGVLTNLFGGWIGARYGLHRTLVSGLALQIITLSLLSFMQPEWGFAFSTIYVMSAQALSGIAKDLTKMSSKSAVKLLPQTQQTGRLLHYVALLTGSKNSLKGFGFFLGGFLLESVGFKYSLLLMAAMLIFILAFCTGKLDSDMGRSKDALPFRTLFAKTSAINTLSTARCFLFASRDIWFVVAVPVFLADSLNWSFTAVGSFLATWVIGYGAIQALTPTLLPRSKSLAACTGALHSWSSLLTIIPLLVAVALTTEFFVTLAVLVGLTLYGIVFAINSSLHSYLILAYARSEQVATDVGFYYMANALGRLVGTLLSGLVFIAAGLSGCLYVSCLLVLVATLLTKALPVESDS